MGINNKKNKEKVIKTLEHGLDKFVNVINKEINNLSDGMSPEYIDLLNNKIKKVSTTLDNQAIYVGNRIIDVIYN